MSSKERAFRRTALLSFRFLGTAVAGSVLMALVAAYGPLSAQLAMLGAFISILGGLFLAYLGQEEERERRRSEAVESLSVPLALAEDRELFRQYQAICRGLKGLGGGVEPILRQSALLKLMSIAEQIDDLAAGRVTFALTEGWRAVYEQILSAPELRTYRSVAWVRNPGYWQDAPGRQSMEVNYAAAHRGVLIERIVVLRDDLWHPGEAFPAEPIRSWLLAQHSHGLWVALARESELARKPDLLVDLGIYGDRAVGMQDLDDRARTLRFVLDFTPEAVRLAEDRWRRLSVHAVPFGELLDSEPAGS